MLAVAAFWIQQHEAFIRALIAVIEALLLTQEALRRAEFTEYLHVPG